MAYVNDKNPAILMCDKRVAATPIPCVVRYAWPGGYPVYYVTKAGWVLSPEAVEDNLDECCDPNDPHWFVVGHAANYEDPDLYCDHYGTRIESAYAEPE